jgi:HTH-type transcriptional regulator/antitoxin MqsA
MSFWHRSRRFDVIETRIHPETGKELRRGVRHQTVVVGSLSRTIDVPGWYPDDDSDAIHSGADLKTFDEAYKTLREAYAAHVRAVRKKLKLTQEEAGVIIGGGKRAFQKYESGRTPPSDAAVGLIELLDRHPEEVATLRAFRLIPAGPPDQPRKRASLFKRTAVRRTKRDVRNVRA